LNIGGSVIIHSKQSLRYFESINQPNGYCKEDGKMNDFAGRATVDTAIQLLREGKPHECIACAEKVISADADNAKAYSVLGAAYAQVGERGMAIAAFLQSLNIEPNARAYFNLGMAYEKSERLKDALEQYEHAVDMDPSYRAAAEAVNRLTKQLAEEAKAAAAAASPHMLGGDDSSDDNPYGITAKAGWEVHDYTPSDGSTNAGAHLLGDDSEDNSE